MISCSVDYTCCPFLGNRTRSQLSVCAIDGWLEQRRWSRGRPKRTLSVFHQFYLFLYYPYKLWMKLGHILGWVNSKVILGLVFILVLQPIALIMKSFGYDPLQKKKDLNTTTYREIRSNFKIDLRKIF